MTLYPEAQRKAQRELDDLTKPGHLPTFEDAENFPYITAVVQEVLRWNPIVPLGECRFISLLPEFFSEALTSALPILMMKYIGAAREAERDIIYRGYHIPAGSFIFQNVWYVTYNLIS